MSRTAEAPTLGQLFRQLLPLSLSDAAMAAADPLLATSLSRLPGASAQLAALGVVKAVAVCLESPIIMVLHASTALSSETRSRQALRRFVTGLAGIITLLFLMLPLPWAFRLLTGQVYHLSSEVQAATWLPLLLMFSWPATIAFRRFFQGHLILQGRGHHMGQASLARVATLTMVLLAGAGSGLAGATLGAWALMLALWVEAALVYFWARQQPVPEAVSEHLPGNVVGVARYYAPLASTMVLMWGGRALLLAILSRAVDAQMALAAWSASWGFVILLANLSRMVQQLVIKYARQVPASRLLTLGTGAGCFCTLLILGLGHSSPGLLLLRQLIGHDPALLAASLEVLRFSLLVPLLVALQNTLQGFCIASSRNGHVNLASLIGLIGTLTLAQFWVARGWPGASAGALAIEVGLGIEVLGLALVQPWGRPTAQ